MFNVFNERLFVFKVLITYITLPRATIQGDNAITRVLVYKLRIFAKSFASAAANARIVFQDVDAKLSAIQNSVPVT